MKIFKIRDMIGTSYELTKGLIPFADTKTGALISVKTKFINGASLGLFMSYYEVEFDNDEDATAFKLANTHFNYI